MLNKLQNLMSKGIDIFSENCGIERETLRIDEKGNLSKTPHPKSFGCRLENPYITTDFAENQIEMITPPLKTPKETYDFLNSLYDIVVMEIEDEMLWPQSMPPIIKDEKDIKVADFNECTGGVSSKEYREYLLNKYGGKRQLISGIHYNFSFNEKLIKELYELEDNKISYKLFKDKIYLKVARNFLRYRWLITYLMGSTPIIDKSFSKEELTLKEKVVSYRNTDIGYANDISLYPDYSTVEAYLNSVNKFISDGVLNSFKELYSPVRPKPKDKNNFTVSLSEEGISYLEYRNIDVNPFDKCGISLDDIEFIQIFNLFLLTKDETNYKNWQAESNYNQNLIANEGIDNVELIRDGEKINKKTWALEIIEDMLKVNKTLKLNKEKFILKGKERVEDEKLTYAYRFKELILGTSYNEGNLSLSKKYKTDAVNNRFKLRGFEDLELSTQILMKESIKRGFKVEVVDRKENFISISNGNKTEFVKQATKTSKDNYVTVLMMENKVVTKKVLDKAKIKIPKGEEFYSIESAICRAGEYANKSIVIKPKSTNFGTGISIFPEGAEEEDIIDGFKLAFKHDNTVLIEEFIKGKEYRFLVFDDKVVGILHRVPANVVGDGKSTIKELVEIKNQDPLRGKGYRTPLEKIKLDDNAKLFLKQQGIDENYIPSIGETIYLRENSNISTGGDSIDYTDDIPNRFKEIAVKSSKAIGARICGVDMMIQDYKNENSNYAIIELNFNPAIHIHSYPYKGKERNIAAEVLKVLNFIN